LNKQYKHRVAKENLENSENLFNLLILLSFN